MGGGGLWARMRFQTMGRRRPLSRFMFGWLSWSGWFPQFLANKYIILCTEGMLQINGYHAFIICSFTFHNNYIPVLVWWNMRILSRVLLIVCTDQFEYTYWHWRWTDRRSWYWDWCSIGPYSGNSEHWMGSLPVLLLFHFSPHSLLLQLLVLQYWEDT